MSTAAAAAAAAVLSLTPGVVVVFLSGLAIVPEWFPFFFPNWHGSHFFSTAAPEHLYYSHAPFTRYIFLFKNKYKCVFPLVPWERLWVACTCARAWGATAQATRKALSVMFSHPRTISHTICLGYFFFLPFFLSTSSVPNRQRTRSPHAHQSCYLNPLLHTSTIISAIPPLPYVEQTRHDVVDIGPW